jgi:DDE superfamily endonuclease
MPLEIPGSLSRLLSLFQPCFTQPSFQTFTVMVVGQLTRVGRHTITGCLTATGLAASWHHSRAHRFFSRARWSVDRLGLLTLGLACKRLLPAGQPLRLAIDDTLVKRFGPKVFGRQRHFDNSAQPGTGPQVAWGNSWVVAGVIVELAFLERSVCLPVLFRLWRPGNGPTQVELACELAGVVARAHPDRRLIVLADGAYSAKSLAPAKLPENACLICRARRDIRLDAPAPPRRRGTMGRPRKKGERLPSLRESARAGGPWRWARVERYGRSETIEFIEQRGIWYSVWGDARVKAVALRDRRAPDQIDAVLISSDPKLKAKRIVELYSLRWAIEVAFRDAKQLGGVGEAQNRTRQAVERSAPFAFLCLTLAIIWYALAGHRPGDVEACRRRAPWYRSKRQPSVEDMLVKLRRTIIASRLSGSMGQQASMRKLADLAEAWELAVA